eukprot:TRINITY_DN16113_c0_g1_i1.p2 TRINITY_DN16113_c0_g1~~TRINITY_DN16113_c0_g1_i1.p2  ORF type:complete len:120 (+),score=48.83 TRINITY_DN16113_c0_g1_i1:63-422(+)
MCIRDSFLTDFAPFKPLYLSSERIGDYEYFFSGETNSASACYVAPEKFVATVIDLSTASLEVRQAMDIFSLGCVLAEIFLKGAKLFDLPKLCLLYTSPSPRDLSTSRMPSSACKKKAVY